VSSTFLLIGECVLLLSYVKCDELAREPSRRFHYPAAAEPSISLFLFMHTKDVAPFFYTYPTKTPLLSDK